MTAAARHPEPNLIEGSYRLIADRPIPWRKSPNRRRLVARVALWNLAAVAAVMLVPRLFA